MAADYYDRTIFDRATYADLIQRGTRPFVMINAVDMTMGSPFQFTQEQFDLLYSDLSSVPVARAVAASSAFPVLLSPITLKNYNWRRRDGFIPPVWIENALSDGPEEPRRFRDARYASSYYDKSQNRRFIHLIDGGVVDNLGVHPVLRSIRTTDGDFSLTRLINLERVKTVAIIVVNAGTKPESNLDTRAQSPGLLDVAKATIFSLLETGTFESVASVEDLVQQLTQDSQARADCEQILREKECVDTELPGGPIQEVDWHVAEVGIEHLSEGDLEPVRRYLLNLPTNLQLPEADVDCVANAGSYLLSRSEGFLKLVADLNGTIMPIVRADELAGCVMHE